MASFTRPTQPANLEPRLLDLANRQRRSLSGIRGSLLSSAQGETINTLMVTSGLKGEGKTTVAVTLGVGMAEGAEGPVLLMDCNSDSPMLDNLFGLSDMPGLAEVVLEDVDPVYCISPTVIPNLFVMPWGGGYSRNSRVLGNPRFKELLNAVGKSMAFVIADAAAVLSTADTLLSIPNLDGVLQVIRCEQTKRDVPVDVKSRVESVGGRFVGTVLNRRRFYLPRIFYGRI